MPDVSSMTRPSSGPNADAAPLVVDLDGTLILDDTLGLMLRSAFPSLRDLGAFGMALSRSRSAAKFALWTARPLPAAGLRYCGPLLALLQRERQAGRHLVLATGAPEPLAHEVAAHLGLFTTVAGSTPSNNLTSHRKAAWLVGRFGHRGFDYVGNSMADLAVWRVCRGVLVCNASRRVRRAARTTGRVIAEIPGVVES